MKRWILAILTALALPLLCPMAMAIGSSPLETTQYTVVAADEITVTLTADRTDIAQGETVTLTATVKDGAGAPVEGEVEFWQLYSISNTPFATEKVENGVATCVVPSDLADEDGYIMFSADFIQTGTNFPLTCQKDVTITVGPGPRPTLQVDLGNWLEEEVPVGGLKNLLTPTVSLANGTELRIDTDYTLTYEVEDASVATITGNVIKGGSQAGRSTTVTVTAAPTTTQSALYDPGTAVYTVTVTKRNLDGCTFNIDLDQTDFPYTGNCRQAEVTGVTVWDGSETRMLADTDYTVSYGDDLINAGAVKVAVIPLDGGNYTWTRDAGKETTYTISPVEGTAFAGASVRTGGSGTEINLAALREIAGQPGEAVYSVTSESELLDCSLAGSILTLKTKYGAVPAAGTAEAVTVDVTGLRNYRRIAVTIQAEFVNKTVVQPVIAVSDGLVYDGTVKDTADIVTGVTNGEGYTGEYIYTYSAEVRNARTYTVTAAVPEENGDFTGTASQTFTVAPAPVTITAGNIEVVQGGAMPEPTYTVTGLIGEDVLTTVPTLSCEAVDTTTAGTYAITIGGADAGGNYVITYAAGTLTVRELEPPAVEPDPPEVEPDPPVEPELPEIQTVPAPAANPSGGTFVNSQVVTLTCATEDAVIYYTLDGSMPTAASNLYTGPITLYGSAALQAIAVKAGMENSPVTTAVFTRYTYAPAYPENIGGNGTGTVTPPAVYPGNTGSSTQTDSSGLTARPEEETFSMALFDGEAEALVEQALSGSASVVIAASSGSGRSEVSLPASALSAIAGGTSAVLTVETPAADVSIPNHSLAALGRLGGEIIIAVEESGRGITIEITANGMRMDRISGGILVSVPIRCSPGTVAKLVDETGNVLATVRKSSAGSNGQAISVPLDGSARVVFVEAGRSFDDVDPSSWAAGAVAFASSHELMNGVSETSFAPDASMTRGMLAVVLHNLENNPGADYSGGFADVANGTWYAEAVQWAADRGIINGVSTGVFAPDDSITREQLVVMLYRYVGEPAASGSALSGFSDAAGVSDWAMQAMEWAATNGVVNGSNGVLNPQGSATRAEVAQMLMNFVSSSLLSFVLI